MNVSEGDAVNLYPTATCNKCLGTYDREAFFRIDSANAFAERQRRAKCIGCELTDRTAAKEEGRILVKAQTARMRHAGRLSRKHTGTILTGDEFGDTFGWQLDRMVHDIEEAEQGNCPYCERPFASMPGELTAITIDIVDPGRKPYYRTNTRWCCSTCNSEKSHTSPELWERKLLSWKQWNIRQTLPALDRGVLF